MNRAFKKAVKRKKKRAYLKAVNNLGSGRLKVNRRIENHEKQRKILWNSLSKEQLQIQRALKSNKSET